MWQRVSHHATSALNTEPFICCGVAMHHRSLNETVKHLYSMVQFVRQLVSSGRSSATIKSIGHEWHQPYRCSIATGPHTFASGEYRNNCSWFRLHLGNTSSCYEFPYVLAQLTSHNCGGWDHLQMRYSSDSLPSVLHSLVGSDSRCIQCRHRDRPTATQIVY